MSKHESRKYRKLSSQELLNLYVKFGKPEEYAMFMSMLKNFIELFGNLEEYNKMLEDTGDMDEVKNLNDVEYEAVYGQYLFIYYFLLFDHFHENLSRTFDYWKQELCSDEDVRL